MRILAVDPSSKGLGFAVLENGDKLVDWGIKYLPRQKPSPLPVVSPELQMENYLRLVEILIDFYQPDAVVLEDPASRDSRRSEGMKGLLHRISEFAANRRIPSHTYSNSLLRSVFAQYGARTKHDRAEFLSRLFPELCWVLPRKRRPWMSENVWMNMFVALALSLCHREKQS